MKGERTMRIFEYDFHLFANTSPQQRYTPLNPNYTGQHYSANPDTDEGTYTQQQDLSPEPSTGLSQAQAPLLYSGGYPFLP